MFYKLVDDFNELDFLYDSNGDFSNELLKHRALSHAVCRANSIEEAKLIFKAEKDTLKLKNNTIIKEATEEEYYEFLEDLNNL